MALEYPSQLVKSNNSSLYKWQQNPEYQEWAEESNAFKNARDYFDSEPNGRGKFLTKENADGTESKYFKFINKTEFDKLSSKDKAEFIKITKDFNNNKTRTLLGTKDATQKRDTTFDDRYLKGSINEDLSKEEKGEVWDAWREVNKRRKVHKVDSDTILDIFEKHDVRALLDRKGLIQNAIRARANNELWNLDEDTLLEEEDVEAIKAAKKRQAEKEAKKTARQLAKKNKTTNKKSTRKPKTTHRTRSMTTPKTVTSKMSKPKTIRNSMERTSESFVNG